jgi:ribonucleoside-diphosphate reductase alpha chain
MGKEELKLERDGIIHKFNVGKHKGYIIAGTYKDGRLGEVCVVLKTEDHGMPLFPDIPPDLLRCEEFVPFYSELQEWEAKVHEQERTLYGGMTGLLIQFGIAISIALQNGVPLVDICDKFSFTRFPPDGRTSNPDIRVATSIPDYVFRWLRHQFLPEDPPHEPQEAEAQAGEAAGGKGQGQGGSEGP